VVVVSSSAAHGATMGPSRGPAQGGSAIDKQ
jgi:hypothetical protein